MVQETKKKPSGKTWSAKGSALVFLAMGIFLCELLAYTWCRVQCTRVGYEISRAAGEQQQLATVREKLQVELARLESPERLANMAKTHMGLKMPSSRQMVVIK
jgi:cell division protein FtsL